MTEYKHSSIALGSFDGLHLGHLAVLNAAKAEDGLTPCVLLCEPLPSLIVREEKPELLMTAFQKRIMLEDMGFRVMTVDFNKIKDLSPEDFVEKVLCERFGALSVSCGFNYRFGSGGSGDSGLLRSLCEARGVRVNVAQEVSIDGETVSSTAVREYLHRGEIEKANTMLSRPFGYISEVVRGNGIGGSVLDCPTANMVIPEGIIAPRFGVYSSFTVIDGKKYPSITNAGCKPTVKGTQPGVETHILDFSSDIYGKVIEVGLLKFLRQERKFSGIDELKARLKEDVAMRRKL